MHFNRSSIPNLHPSSASAILICYFFLTQCTAIYFRNFPIIPRLYLLPLVSRDLSEWRQSPGGCNLSDLFSPAVNTSSQLGVPTSRLERQTKVSLHADKETAIGESIVIAPSD
jgi:hypothetical protein